MLYKSPYAPEIPKRGLFFPVQIHLYINQSYVIFNRGQGRLKGENMKKVRFGSSDGEKISF